MGLVVIGILNGSITTALTVFIVNLDVSAFGNKVSASFFHERSCFPVTSICDLWSLRLDIRYPASRGYIFAVLAGVRKVASADNRSNPSRNLDE